MEESELVGYVGPPQLHDGRILRFSHWGSVASVLVEGDDGRQFTLEFEGVEQVEADRPEGMVLYALSEMAIYAVSAGWIVLFVRRSERG